MRWPEPSLPLAACGSFPYTSPTSNYSYVLNNCNNATFDEGESMCNSVGGHLVVYPTKADQDDAEGYYIQLGGCREAAGSCSGAQAWCCRSTRSAWCAAAAG